MARKIKFKTNWKKIICAILAAILCITAIGGIAAIANNDSKSISSTAFTRGGLDENGKYVETDQSIYTEEAFGCMGLRVVPSFESNSTYDVYYYDYNDTFVEAKLGLSDVYDEDYPLHIATSCRIVIHPEIPDDINEKDFKIAFYEVYEIAREFDITIDKKQSYKYAESYDLYDEAKTVKNKNFKPYTEAGPDKFNSLELTEDADTTEHPVKVTSAISVDGTYDAYDVYVYLETGEERWPIVALFDSAGKTVYADGAYVWDVVSTKTVVKPCWVKLTINVPELESYEGVHLMAAIPDDADCYIFGYND